jgi:uncharacterized CHY-type Zn-finger protein
MLVKSPPFSWTAPCHSIPYRRSPISLLTTVSEILFLSRCIYTPAICCGEDRASSSQCGTPPFLSHTPPADNSLCSIHVLNAQVSIRAPCCRKWFDCAECHAEAAPDHPLRRQTEITFACKKCKKVFRKDATDFDEDADKFCPHCDNEFVLDAVVPQGELRAEIEDPRKDSRMIKDDRVDDKAKGDKELEEWLLGKAG